MPVYSKTEPAPSEKDARPARSAAVDGLRALAIVGVLLYHTRPSLLTGGFLGVTVFLVLTGFFATRSVLRALDGDGFSYGRYLLRRVARLLPPVLLAIALAALGTYLFSPSLLTKVQPDALPAALFCVNWSYIFRQVSYFEAAGLPSPLTHLWYLGVVMQFYLVWPLALLLVARRARGRAVPLALTTVLVAASSLLMALLFDPAADTARVYYGTDARAAELLVGAFLAIALHKPRKEGEKDAEKNAQGRPPALGIVVRTLVGTLCLAALGAGYAVATGSEELLYRGGYLVAAIVSAALLACALEPRTPLAALLGMPPLRYLGTRSFSLYLVHYPLLILMNPATRTTELAWWEWVLQLAVVVVAAEVFYRLVEAPCAALAQRIGSGRGNAGQAEAPRKQSLAPAVATALVATFGAGAVAFLAAAPLDWGAVAQERAVALRPELAGPTAREDEPGIPIVMDPMAEGAGEPGQAGGNPEDAPEPEPERPAPVAEEVPENLPWESWTYDPETETCDARALIIGDSVTEGAAPVLRDMLPNAYVDGEVSRQIWVGQDVYRADVASGYDPDVVIVALGGNGLIRDDSIVQAIVDAVGDKPLYFVTIRCPLSLQDSNNEALRRVAAEHDNVGIIDWHGASEGHSEYLVDDGIHLTYDGMDAFSQLIRQALCGV